MAKTFLWIEDRKGKASYTFWANLMKQLCSDVIVESKKNNSELVKAVRTLQETENRYIIVFDNSFDISLRFPHNSNLYIYIYIQFSIFLYVKKYNHTL